LWTEEIVDTFLDGVLDNFGVVPRTAFGLVGIPLHPFLHLGFEHLIGNTVAFLVLGWLVLLRETWHFVAVFVASTLFGGLGVWLFGREACHIGASGVVYGFMGYLMLAGLFERKLGTILLSLAVGVTFSGALLGMLPTDNAISWEGHLFGFLSGAVMAWALADGGHRARRRLASALVR
jgi:membrane associated rhomboid family serine protease